MIDFDSQLGKRCIQSIFDNVAKMDDPLQVQKFLPFDTPEWRDALWHHHGLRDVVCQARSKFRKKFEESICDSVGMLKKRRMTQLSRRHIRKERLI